MSQKLPDNARIKQGTLSDNTPETGYRDNKAKPLYYSGELARAYVPHQVYSERLKPAEGLRHGTIFPELYSPYQEYTRKHSGTTGS